MSRVMSRMESKPKKVKYMYYCIYGEDVPHSLELRRTVCPVHLKRLEELKAQNRLLIAGPLLNQDQDEHASHGFCGSIIIASFDNIDDAEAWAAADPYVTAGVYARIYVKPFKQVF